MSNADMSRRGLEEGFGQGNLTVVDELTGENFVNHDPSDGGDYSGRAGLKQQIQTYRTAFPDLQVTVEDIFEAGDEVAIRWSAHGTHRGDLMGLAPTGATVTVTGISIDRYENGVVAESWTNWDVLGLLRQLGASPAPGSLGEKVGIQLQHLTARRQRHKAGVS